MAELALTEAGDAARRRRVLLGLVCLAALYVAALAWRLRDFAVDDAYIGFAFLRNLLEGHGFTFHPGGPAVEGVTNIGWIIALAPAAALTDAVTAAKLLGALLLFGAILLTGAVGRGLSSRVETLPHADTLMLAPPILLAASFEFLYFPLAGMETAALSCTLLAMAWIALSAPHSLALPVLGALAFTLHPEAVLVYPIYVVLRRISPLPPAGEGGEGDSPSRVRVSEEGDARPPVTFATGTSLSRFAGEGRSALLYAALLALITLARWLAFGTLLPNTFAAKPPAEIGTMLGGLVELASGRHLGTGFPAAGLLGLWLMAQGWLRLRRSAPDAAAILGAIAAAGLLFAIYARPDWTQSARYFAPYLPAALLLLWTGALDIAHRLWPGRAGPIAAFAGLLLLVQGLTLGARLGAMEDFPGYVLAGRTLIGPAEAVARIVPEGETIATRRIGALAYVSRRPVFDYAYGLTDPEVARAVARRGGFFERPGEPDLAEIWKAREPRWILEDEAVLADIARRAGGSLDGFTLHGMTYRAERRFPIAPEVDWVLARRIDQGLAARD
jgi:arabinofuranosyltransferase